MASEDNKNDSEELKGTEKAQDRPWWSEMMKEMTLTGLATVFMTEDSVRSYLKDKKIPKELVGLVLDSLGKKKDDFYGLLAKEFGRVLGKIDLSQEITKFMEKHKVNVQISFERKETE
jgi:hypothetical protein